MPSMLASQPFFDPHISPTCRSSSVTHESLANALARNALSTEFAFANNAIFSDITMQTSLSHISVVLTWGQAQAGRLQAYVQNMHFHFHSFLHIALPHPYHVDAQKVTERFLLAENAQAVKISRSSVLSQLSITTKWIETICMQTVEICLRRAL